MCGRDANGDFERSVRRAFARLTQEDLPQAAAARGWPVRTPEEFEGLLLDHLCESPAGGGRDQASLFDLVLAVEIGEQLLAGQLCCATMKHRLRRSACGRALSSEGLATLFAALRQAPRN